MNKTLFFVCILTCYAQATVVADLIALKNEFTQMLPSKAQEKMHEHLPVMIKHDERSPITSASLEFVKGFGKGVCVFTLVSLCASYKGLADSGCLINDDADFTRCAILASGAPACAQDVISSLDVIFSGLKKDGCKHCAQRVARQDVLNALARIGGSVCAMGTLYLAACMVQE